MAGAALGSAGSLFPEEFRSLFQAGGGSGTAAPRGWSGANGDPGPSERAIRAIHALPRARSTLAPEASALLNF